MIFLGNIDTNNVIYFYKENSKDAILSTQEWNDIYKFLKAEPRKYKAERMTSETKIEVEINLDGSGKSSISTRLNFFDHMLEQISKHGNIDLFIEAQGDLQIDEHHTIEDVAITLGEAFLKALGNKKGIER